MVAMKPTDGDLDATIRDTTTPSSAAETRSRQTALVRHSDQLAGYALGEVIGRGGMGEVVLAHDLRIGRDVAIKRMREGATNEEAVARFLREAKIQARLDHPAIVPVHELGEDAHGEPYFTMKRLAGVTLAALIETGKETRQRLLRAFVDVVLAIDLAHSKNIIHRDLKPANIMLGDFGEVYVLDWGLAREVDEQVPTAPISTTSTPLSGVTAMGAVLGTPGYMPPEQIHDASAVGKPADVYALGAVLFEILTGQPLHPRADALASTLEETDPSPTARCPDDEIPPELERLCVAALATDARARPSARQLAEGVQSYLDGDRDVVMRRELARDAFETARRALAEHREDEAMRAAGRSIVLDPSSEATAIVTRLMLEPPRQAPPDLVAELAAEDLKHTILKTRQSRLMSLIILPLIALAAWNGARSWPLLGSISALAVVLSVTAHSLSRNPSRADRELYAYAVGMAAMVAMIGRMCSPFVIAPGTTCLVIASIATYPTITRRPWPVFVGVIAGWMIPVLLELSGLIRPTWSFAGGELAIHSYAIDLDGYRSTVFVLTSTILVFVVTAILAATNARINRDAQQQLLTQRWRLEKLIPT